MLLSPATTLVQACSRFDLTGCDTCPEGPVPGRYRSFEPCKCGDEAADAGLICKNGKVQYPVCCAKDRSKETGRECYCGDSSDGSMVNCPGASYCDASAEGGPRCYQRQRCSIVDGSAPLPKGGPYSCQCGDSVAYPGYTCLESENKVTLDIPKCSEGTTLADRCACSADSPPYTMAQVFAGIVCQTGQECNVDGDGCTWPVCVEGKGPSSKEEHCKCKNGDDETTCDYGEVCKSGFCQCEPTSEVLCEYDTIEADESCPLSNCKHDPKSSASIKYLGSCQRSPSSNQISYVSKTDDGYSIMTTTHQRKDISDESCEGKVLSKMEIFYTSGGCRITAEPSVPSGSKITFVYDAAKDPKLSDGGTHNMHVFWSVFVPCLVLLLL